MQTVTRLIASLKHERVLILLLYYISNINLFIEHVIILDRGFGGMDTAIALHKAKQSFIMSCRYFVYLLFIIIIF